MSDTPGYDVRIELDLSVPEEVRCHPKVHEWVEKKEKELSRTLNAMMQFYGEHGVMVVPVPFPETRKEKVMTHGQDE